jgi:hypothetical protein
MRQQQQVYADFKRTKTCDPKASRDNISRPQSQIWYPKQPTQRSAVHWRVDLVPPHVRCRSLYPPPVPGLLKGGCAHHVVKEVRLVLMQCSNSVEVHSDCLVLIAAVQLSFSLNASGVLYLLTAHSKAKRHTHVHITMGKRQ